MMQSSREVQRNRALALSVALAVALVVLPEIAQAQVAGADIFGGITDLLRSLVSLLIFQWARLLAIGVIAWEGFKWWKGRADFMDLALVIVACFVVAFSPAIINRIWSAAGGGQL